MEIIEKLFQMVNDDNIYSNPFETAEVNNTREIFCKKYIYTTKELKDGQNDMWECFVEALIAERRQAFRVGYNTAVKLIFSGGGYGIAFYLYRLLRGKIKLLEGVQNQCMTKLHLITL